MASRSAKSSVHQSPLRKNDHKNDFFDRFHKNGKICNIPATSRKVKKSNVFAEMRPKPGIYVDYDISQTDIKMDAGATRMHLERTVAEYIPPPPGVDISQPKPPKKKKIKYFHGGPPVWEFEEEKRKRKIEEMQIFYKERLETMMAKSKKENFGKRRSKNVD